VPTLQQALDQRPELAHLFGEYYGRLWRDDLVDPVLLELCRLRIVQLLGDDEQARLRYRTAVDAGLSEDKIADLPHAHTSAHFDDHERACIAYAEQHLLDVHGLSDEDAARVQRGMSDPQFVAFSIALGAIEGAARLRLALGLSSLPPGSVGGPVVVDPPAPGALH
jgi:alkylhydroperoxidase family enzyme